MKNDELIIYDNLEEARRDAEEFFNKYGKKRISDRLTWFQPFADPPISDVIFESPKITHEWIYEYIKRLIELGSEVNSDSLLWKTYIPTVMELFLEHGLDVHVKNRKDDTTILQHWRCREDCVLSLLNHGAEFNCVDEEGGYILHRCSDVAVAKRLLELGMDVNICDYMGRTPLHVNSSPKVIDFLIDNGGDINARDKLGQTPLHAACTNTSKARKLLNAGANVNAKDIFGCSPLNIPRTDAEYCKLLIEHGADLDTRDQAGNTPLHKAWTEKHVELFVENGIGAYTEDEEWNTPLHKVPNAWTSEALIGFGADVNAKNVFGMTPLHLCHNVDKQNVLMNHGAEVNALDHKRQTPFHLIATSEKIPDEWPLYRMYEMNFLEIAQCDDFVKYKINAYRRETLNTTDDIIHEEGYRIEKCLANLVTWGGMIDPSYYYNRITDEYTDKDLLHLVVTMIISLKKYLKEFRDIRKSIEIRRKERMSNSIELSNE